MSDSIAPEAQSEEALSKFVYDVKAQLGTRDASVGEIKAASEELTARLRAVELAQRDQRRHTPDGTDRDVADAYTRSGLNDAQIKRLGRPADITEGGSVTHREIGGAYIGHPDHGVVRMFGESRAGRWTPGLLDDTRPKSAWQAELQELVEQRSMVQIVRGKRASAGSSALVREHLAKGPGIIGRVFSDNAGEGAEFIQDTPLPVLQRELELSRNVEALFGSMAMGSGTNRNPFHSVGAQAFVHGVPTSGDLDPADLPRSVPTTAELTADPTTLTVTIPADSDAEEDSVVAWAPYARMNLVEALRDASEDAIINADTGTHGDTGVAGWNPRSRWNTLGAANDHRYAWIGLRHRSIDVSSNVDQGAVAETVAGLMAALINLKAPHAFGDVVYITSPEFLLAQLLTDTNILTVDKYGPAATILTGEVARIGGHPLVVSEFVDKQYNASGIYDDSTKTKTGVLVLNRSRFLMARRRGLRVDSEVVRRRHTSYWTASERKTLHTVDQSTTKNVAWLYNLSIS